MFNYYKNVSQSSLVLGSIELEEFLSIVKNGNEYLSQIKKAREVYLLDKKSYKNIKNSKLPCYTFNFTFEKRRLNSNIINSTGFIYIDIDGTTDINLSNPLIYASWLSLSDNGRGILVKVKNINNFNFNIEYDNIAKALNVDADKGARKLNQLNVLSYDPELYLNINSNIWIAESIDSFQLKKDHYSSLIYNNNTVGTVVGSFNSFRFDNLDELIANVEFNGDVIYDYKSKIGYSEIKIPFKGIRKGKRNSILNAIAYQIIALNPNITYDVFLRLLNSINEEHCNYPLSSEEIESIVDYVYKKDKINPIKNAERRFVFNSDYDLTTKEKRQQVIKFINNDKVEKSKFKIEKGIKEWDFIENGKITQKGLATVINMNIKTIKKYYPLYKSEIQALNIEYKTNNRGP